MSAASTNDSTTLTSDAASVGVGVGAGADAGVCSSVGGDASVGFGVGGLAGSGTGTCGTGTEEGAGGGVSTGMGGTGWWRGCIERWGRRYPVGQQMPRWWGGWLLGYHGRVGHGLHSISLGSFSHTGSCSSSSPRRALFSHGCKV